MWLSFWSWNATVHSKPLWALPIPESLSENLTTDFFHLTYSDVSLEICIEYLFSLEGFPYTPCTCIQPLYFYLRLTLGCFRCSYFPRPQWSAYSSIDSRRYWTKYSQEMLLQDALWKQCGMIKYLGNAAYYILSLVESWFIY